MSKPSVLLSGVAFGESPRWHEGRLWFADWGTGEIVAVDAAGRSEVVARVPTAPLCFDFSPRGDLLVLAGGQQRLLRIDPAGDQQVYAELGHLCDKPWNDIVVDARGNAFVNNIGFDFPGGTFAEGIIAVVGPDGHARQVADGLAFPNGMALTDDGTTLVVAESYAGRLTAFHAGPDGSLSQRRTWGEVAGAAPDGICMDAEGAVWFADVPGQRCVRVREGGEVAETVALDRGGFACALGGDDGRTLFVLAAAWTGGVAGPDAEPTGQVQTLRVAVPGQAGSWSSASRA